MAEIGWHLRPVLHLLCNIWQGSAVVDFQKQYYVFLSFLEALPEALRAPW